MQKGNVSRKDAKAQRDLFVFCDRKFGNKPLKSNIEPDWPLIYSITNFELRPARTGSHAELFE